MFTQSLNLLLGFADLGEIFFLYTDLKFYFFKSNKETII